MDDRQAPPVFFIYVGFIGRRDVWVWPRNHRCRAGSTVIYSEDVWEGYDVGAGTSGPGRRDVFSLPLIASYFSAYICDHLGRRNSIRIG